jgi:hypothetical protein
VREVVARWPERKPFPKHTPYIPSLWDLHLQHRDGRPFTAAEVELLLNDPGPGTPGNRPIVEMLAMRAELAYGGARADWSAVCATRNALHVGVEGRENPRPQVRKDAQPQIRPRTRPVSGLTSAFRS